MDDREQVSRGWASIEEEYAAQHKADAIHRDIVCILAIIVVAAFAALILLGLDAWGDWDADQVRSDAVVKIEGR
jgi:hypothetical protein